MIFLDRMDNLEKSKVLRRSENFSTSKFFCNDSYITTDDRKNARTMEDILPSKFEKMTESSYKVGRNIVFFFIYYL